MTRACFHALLHCWGCTVFNPSQPGSEGKRVTGYHGAFKTPIVHDKRQIQRFLHQGSSPPTETAAHSSIFLHSDSEWPPRARAERMWPVYLSAIKHSYPSLFKQLLKMISFG